MLQCMVDFSDDRKRFNEKSCCSDNGGYLGLALFHGGQSRWLLVEHYHRVSIPPLVKYYISTPEGFHTISIYSTALAVAIGKIELPPHIGIDSMAACRAQSWGFNTLIGQILATTSQHLRDFILFPFTQQNLLLQQIRLNCHHTLSSDQIEEIRPRVFTDL